MMRPLDIGNRDIHFLAQELVLCPLGALGWEWIETNLGQKKISFDTSATLMFISHPLPTQPIVNDD